MKERFSEKHILDRISKNIKIINCKDKVIVGVSGGVDSMFLLYCLHRILKKEQIIVATMNHMIRKDAKKDISFVKNICTRYDVLFVSKQYNVPKIAKENNEGLEECGRRLRYDFFREVKKKYNAKWIITAHHKDDLAETIIMNIMRGSFIHGLVGIKKINNDVIRPILGFTKEEIYTLSNRFGIKWKEDSTNIDTKYKRNFIRHILLRNFKKYHDDILDVLQKLSNKAEKLSSLIKEKADIVIKNNYHKIILDSFNKLDIYIQKEIICNLFDKLYESKQDITSAWLDEIIRFIKKARVGKVKRFGKLYYLIKDYKDILITRDISHNIKNQNNKLVCKIPGGIEWRNKEIEIKEIKKQVDFKKTDCYLCYLDRDLILGDELIVRNWENGDFFIPLGMTGKKKLQDFFTDMKVSKNKRNKIPIITTQNNDIIWIAGLRMDDRFKITDNTKRILAISLKN